MSEHSASWQEKHGSRNRSHFEGVGTGLHSSNSRSIKRITLVLLWFSLFPHFYRGQEPSQCNGVTTFKVGFLVEGDGDRPESHVKKTSLEFAL